VINSFLFCCSGLDMPIELDLRACILRIASSLFDDPRFDSPEVRAYMDELAGRAGFKIGWPNSPAFRAIMEGGEGLRFADGKPVAVVINTERLGISDICAASKLAWACTKRA
jgi:hypothetical protein